MADQAESSRRAPPTPLPPSPTVPEDSSSEAILWAASDSSSIAPHTDLLSLWLSNYTALPQLEVEEEPVADVPTLLNFDLESPFLDLVDWKTTSTAVRQAPNVTQPLWVQLHAPAAGEVDDLARLALGIQSPKASILPLALRTQDPEAFVSPLGIKTFPTSSEIEAPQAPLSSLALGLQSPPASFGIQTPRTPISPLAFGTEPSILPLALGIQSPQISFGIQSAPSSFSSQPPIPCALPMAPPVWNLPSIPCTLPMAPPLWSLPSIPYILPMAPPLWNFLPSSSPVPERRSWSVFPSTPPPARQQLLLPHSASASVSSSSSHPSHQPRHFFPTAKTGYQQQLPVAHAPVTFSTPNANFPAGFPASRRPSWSLAMAPRRSWTPNQPWISNGQDMKLPIPRRPRFLLSPAAATMPAPAPVLANLRSSVGNMPSWNARGDVPVGNHQPVQTGESSRPRKRSKLALQSSGSEVSHSSHDGAKVVPIAREMLSPKPALNRNGKARALPGTATDFQSMFARYKREKIKQRIKILETLVPNGDKADMAILLEQTHVYIKFLEQQIKVLKSSVDWKLAAPFAYDNIDLLHPQG